MSKRVRSRRLLALFAAYVVALQGLLLPLTVAAFAAPEMVLCTSAGEAGHQPAGHDTGCACAAGCGMRSCAPPLAAPPSHDVIVWRTAPSAVIAPLPAILIAVTASEVTPHSPRAPPVV